MSEVEAEPKPASDPVRPLGERLTYALRQIALMTVVLLVLARLADSSRPDEAGARDLVTSPFLWAIVAWLIVLLFNAIAFERSQMHNLESVPLLVAIGLGAIAFLGGVAAFDEGSTGDRLFYLALNSIGVGLFWWAVIGIATLMWTRTRP